MRSGGGKYTRNAQTSGQLVKNQRSLKSPRKRLICYLTLSGKIVATVLDKRERERQIDVAQGDTRSRAQLGKCTWPPCVQVYLDSLPW